MVITIQTVIDQLEESVPKTEPTVDGLLFGETDAPVQGIVTTFWPPIAFSGRPSRSRANLVISHEGIFYSHRPSDMPEPDSVFREKRRWIEASGLAVYRCHDALHRRRPDLIARGLIRSLGWEAYVEKELPAATILAVPRRPLQTAPSIPEEQAATALFARDGGSFRVLHPHRDFGRVSGRRPKCNPLFEGEGVDVAITGEGPEWERRNMCGMPWPRERSGPLSPWAMERVSSRG